MIKIWLTIGAAYVITSLIFLYRARKTDLAKEHWRSFKDLFVGWPLSAVPVVALVFTCLSVAAIFFFVVCWPYGAYVDGKEYLEKRKFK